ncbi:MAG: lipopolysaccharide heptosyltransferase II [Candidatus Omnitrophica bacterium]|nr:lipopolysaccharide heptosyltransferase II [Candidatus Omnitrophota bacterium]
MKRILIVRTDRLGDVVLSTPVIKAVRKAYPDAFISMMVSSYAKDVVEGSPFLNKVIAFDKKKHGGLFGTAAFVSKLRKNNFDTAFVLHPVKRIHIILWLAGIKRRIGYDKKWGFLLTDRIPHKKQFGEKHEIDYNLDVIRSAGINTDDKALYVPVRPEARSKVEAILKDNGFTDKDEFIVMHPGASCPSKRWPAERFGWAADELIERFHKKVVVVAGTNDSKFAQETNYYIKNEALDLSGNLSVAELAALLEKARLLISNDSGPVHIAVALGVPVVVIFGRNQPGLSYRRWGPAGKHDIILHKDVGCVNCLAHNCKIGFKCLQAITVDEVVKASGRILEKRN